MQSLKRALDVLEILKDEGPLGLAAIARGAHSNKATVLRVLVALSEDRWVWQDPRDRRYWLGHKVLEFASANGVYGLRLRDLARPFMERLRDSTKETVNLGVLEGDRLVCVAVCESPHPLRVAFSVGQAVQMHCTAMGKAILSYIPEEDVVRFVGGEPYPQLTGYTITSLGQLMDDLAATRTRGLAMDDLEYVAGTRCVAAPVFDHAGRAIAAVSLSAPATRLSRASALELGSTVRGVAATISAQIGSIAGPLTNLVGPI